MGGHIQAHPNGKKDHWYIVVEAGREVVDGELKRKRIKRLFVGSERAAKKELARYESELESGVFIETTNLTVAKYLMHWLDTYCKPNLAPSTYSSYARIVNSHIIPYLGVILLEKLQPMQIQAYYSKKLREGRRDGKGGLSPRSVQYHHRVLREALQHALKWQLLSRNPADAVEAPKPSRPDMQTLGPDEVKTLLTLLDKHPDRELFISAAFTGMRQGELLGLRWSDVDLDKGMARIQQTVGWLPKQGFIFREPKTKKSRRQIVLPSMVIDAFKKRKKKQAEDKLMLGQEYEDIGLVFCAAYGQPLDPSGVSRRFKTVAKKLGRPELRFHDLRHTHATLLLSQGVHPKVVQERLGHESINITLDTSSHVLPGMQEEAVAKLEIFISNSNGHMKGTSSQK